MHFFAICINCTTTSPLNIRKSGSNKFLVFTVQGLGFEGQGLGFDAPFTTSSPIGDDLGKCEAVLAEEIPTDKAQAAKLRSLLFKLADSHGVPALKKNACLQADNSLGVAQNSLNRIVDLKAQKDGYRRAFLALDEENNATLAKKERVSNRIQCINKTIA